MNEYGALAAWYLQGKTEVLGGKRFLLDVVRHKSHIELPRTEPGPPLWKSSHRPHEPLYWSTKFDFFFVPRTSTDELSITFYAEFRYICRIFLSGRVSKMQRSLNVQNSTLRAHETGRNVPLKCWGVWLSPVFGVRYIPLQCLATVCQHTWSPLALVPLFHSHNVLVKSLTVFVTDFAETFWKKIQAWLQEVNF